MSCAYTLARKYKLANFTHAFNKLGKLLRDPDTNIKLNWPDSRTVRHDYKSKVNLPKLTDTIRTTWSAKFTKNTFEKPCALCGTSSKIEMHHLRSVKNVRARMRTGDNTYAKWIGATQRKQIHLCSYHHHLYHHGNLTAEDLTEIGRYNQ